MQIIGNFFACDDYYYIYYIISLTKTLKINYG